MLWARVRRAWLLVAAIALLVMGLTKLNERSFSLPALFGSGGFVLWTTFLPLLWAVAVADSFAAKTQAAEARPGRRVAGLDLALFLVSTAAAAAAFVVLGGSAETPTSAVAHVLIMSGLACSVTLLAGAGGGVLAASALVVVTTPYGRTGFAAGYVRVLQPDGHATWSLAVGIVLCATACCLLVTRRTTIRLGGTQRLAG